MPHQRLVDSNRSDTVEHDHAGSRTYLICDSLRYVKPVQLSVQQLRQILVELVSTSQDTGDKT